MKIMFVGDICLGEYYLSFGHGPKSYLKHKNVFSNVKPLFDTSTLVIGNLEAAITDHNLDIRDPESMVLRAHTKHAHVLKDAGFRVLQVANNHTIQHSPEGLHQTIEILKENDISVVGLKNQAPLCIEENNIKIGILAASDVPDNTYEEQNEYQYLNDDFYKRIVSEVNNFDHLIVMLHWGLESSTKPLKYQRDFCEKLYKAGVRAIIGSHPHLCYEIERRENFIAAYSLGNFVFDLCYDNKFEKTGILSIDFQKKQISSEFHPVTIEDNGCLPSLSAPTVKIEKTFVPYNLGSKMRFEFVKKNLYFIKNIHKGNTSLKLKFYKNKIKYLFAKRK